MKLKFDIVANIIGGVFELVNDSLKLFDIPKKYLLLHELRLEYQLWDKSSSLNRLIDQLSFQIKEINKSISLINDNIILLNDDFKNIKIRKVHTNKYLLKNSIKNILKKIELPEGKSNTLMPYIKQSLYSFVDQLTTNVKEDTKNVVSTISEKKEYFLNKQIIPIKYKKNIYEVVDLYILGYKSTSLLVLGKIFEDILNNYLKKISHTKKIGRSLNLKKMTFQNKLDYLYSKKLIIRKDWLVLSKLVWDRNIGGHSVKNDKIAKDSQFEAQPTIKLSLNLIKKYCEKVERYKG